MTSTSEADGSYFDSQELQGEFNPFQAFGLAPDDFMLTQHGAKLHYELALAVSIIDSLIRESNKRW